MPEKRTILLQLISSLLHYPDEDLLGRLDELASAAADLKPGRERTALQAFLKELGRMSLIQVQERYTALFDMDPATTLNVTYHAYGDNEKRAAALARLQHHYEQAGWERVGGELPDYLPLMLEFLSVCPDPEHALPVRRCLQGMQPLVETLEKRAPAYADLLRLVVRMAAADGASMGTGGAPAETEEARP